MVREAMPQTSIDELYARINAAREEQHLSTLISTAAVCEVTERLPQDLEAVTQEVFTKECPQCTTTAITTVAKYASIDDNLKLLQSSSSAATILNNKLLTHVCIVDRDPELLVFFAGFTKPTPRPEAKKPAPAPLSESQLFEALTIYREAHKVSRLTQSENLCVYARKRLNDHIEMFKNTKKENYPVPDKYPLDAHEGFKKDAESGYSFQTAGMNRLAENLAYWPNATFATQIIEWGWDASTEGHKETQLSTEYSHACLTNKDGFTVAIFGHN